VIWMEYKAGGIIVGLSTDSKPDVSDGWIFFERNTQKLFIKDTTWKEIGGGKGGTVSVTRGSSVTVTFGTAFSGTPNVTVSFGEDQNYVVGEKGVSLAVYSVSTTGFTVRYDDPSGSGDSPATIQWIATDAGNT